LKNWGRHDTLLAATFVLVAGLVVVLGVLLIRPMTIMCDGSYPRWMLEATDYDGRCVEVLPSDAAPANADWTLYCTGYCRCDPAGDTYRGACRAAEQ